MEFCVNSCVRCRSCSTRLRAAWHTVSPAGALAAGKRSAWCCGMKLVVTFPASNSRWPERLSKKLMLVFRPTIYSRGAGHQRQPSGPIHVYSKRVAHLRCTAVNSSAASLGRQICPLPTPQAWRSSGHSEPTPHPLKTGTRTSCQRTGGSPEQKQPHVVIWEEPTENLTALRD